MRLFQHQRPTPDERLLWSRDIRFVRRLAEALPGGRILELDTGAVCIGPAIVLTDSAAAQVANDAKAPDYGLVAVDTDLPPADRYLTALSAAVQESGLAARIGMAPSTQVVQTKTLDYFFSLRKLHGVAFQPIVELATRRAPRVRVPVPARDADAPAVDQRDRPGGHRHRALGRARCLPRSRSSWSAPASSSTSASPAASGRCAWP